MVLFVYRREISALTNENYSLERQLFAYQKSISVANNIARMSISSPSKPTPSIGFGSSPGSYRALNQLGAENSYYGNDVISSRDDDYYDRDGSNMAEIAGSESPQQQPHQAPPQHSQQQAQYQQYYGSNYNNGGSGANSARQSLSGPASPHHQSYLHLNQPSVNYQQQQPQPQQQYQFHQLPLIPNKLSYSNSGYRLNSPGATSPLHQYHHMHPGGGLTEDVENSEQNEAGGRLSGIGSSADDYNTFNARYKLKV